MFNTAEQIPHMIRRIEQDQAPYAILTFQDVDARIILLDLPEMAHIQTQDIADDGLVDGIMSGDEDRLAVVFPSKAARARTRTSSSDSPP